MTLSAVLQLGNRMIAEVRITRVHTLAESRSLCHYKWSADWRTGGDEFFMAKGTVSHPYDQGAMSLLDAVLRQIVLTPQYLKSLEGVREYGDKLSRLESEAAGKDGKSTSSSLPPLREFP